MRKRKLTRSDFSPWMHEPVVVCWLDVTHCEEITEKELKKEPDVTFTSYGWVIADNGKSLTIASTMGNEQRDRLLREVTRIPWSLVQRIKYLQEVNE